MRPSGKQDKPVGMNRILVELYDNDALENIVSLEIGRYDKLVFLCFKDSDPDPAKRRVMSSVISGRTGIELVFEEAEEKSIDAAVKALSGLPEKFPESVFDVDLTGGDEIFIAALGMFLSGYQGNAFSAHVSDVIAGSVSLAMSSKKGSGDNKENEAGEVNNGGVLFSFSDIIRLYGGLVIGTWPEEFSGIMDRKRYEILRVWNALKDLAADWNRFCSISYVNGIEKDEEGYISRRFSKSGEKVTAERIMSRLKKRGIVSDYSMDDNTLKYRLRDSAVTEELYVSSGTALEMYTALAASGTGMFRECYTKVLLDVNGVISKQGSDPTNELDVTMMYGYVPVFVSCKNTEPTKEYLYEIKTMAEHFGGKYALAMLVSSKTAFQPVKERAKEMHIMLIDDVQSLSLKEFRNAIARTVRKFIDELHD